MTANTLLPAHLRRLALDPQGAGGTATMADLLSRDFAGVDCWISDLDNTLYDPSARLFPLIEARMTAFVQNLLDIDAVQADLLRAQYWREHGTTLSGLMAHHNVNPSIFLADVHDIDMSALTPDPALAAAILSLPGQRIVHTNADAAYARRVLARRGLDVFDAVYGVEEAGWHPKPDPRSFEMILAAHNVDPARAAMFEDDPRNLEVPFALGMRTVLVGPGRLGPDEIAAGEQHGAHVLWQCDVLSDMVTALAAALERPLG